MAVELLQLEGTLQVSGARRAQSELKKTQDSTDSLRSALEKVDDSADFSGITGELAGVRSEIDQTQRAAAGGIDIDVGTTGTEQAKSEITDVLDLAEDRSATIRIDADGTPARTEIGAVERDRVALDGNDVSFDVNANTAGADASLLSTLALGGRLNDSDIDVSVNTDADKEKEKLDVFGAATGAASSAATGLQGVVSGLAAKMGPLASGITAASTSLGTLSGGLEGIGPSASAATGDLGELERAVNEADTGDVNVGVDLDSAEARAALAAWMAAQAAADGDDIDVRIDVDAAGAIAQVGVFSGVAAAASTVSGGFAASSGLVSTGLVGIAGVAVAAATAIGPLLGGLAALGSFSASAAAGFGLVGGAIYVLVQGLYDGGAAFDALSARASGIGNQLAQALGPASLAVADIGFAALDVAENYIPILGNRASDVVAVMQDRFASFFAFLSQGGVGFELILTILEASENVVGSLTGAILAFGEGLIGVFAAGIPYVVRLGQFIEGIAVAFAGWATSAEGASQIQGFIESAIPVFSALWDAVVGVGGALLNFASVAGGDLASTISVLGTIITGVIDGFTWLYDTVGGSGIAFGLLAAAAVALIPVAVALWGVITGVGVAGGIAAGIIAGLAAVATLIYNNWSTIGPALQSIWDGIVAGVQAAWGAIAPIISAALSAVLSVVQSVVASIVAFWDAYGAQIIAAAQVAWGAVSDVVSTALQAVLSLVQSVVGQITAWWTQNGETIIAAAQNVWTAVQAVVGVALDVILALIQFWGPTVVGIFQAAWTLISSVVSAVWSVISGIIQGGLDVILGIITVFAGVLTGDWETVWSGLGQVVQGWQTVIGGVIQAAITLIMGIFTAGLQILSGLWASVWGALGPIIMPILTAIGTFISTTFTAIYTTISTILTTIVTFITTWATTIATFFTTAFTTVVTAVSTAFTAIYTTVVTILTTIAAYVTPWLELLGQIFIVGIALVVGLVAIALEGLVTLFTTIFTAIYDTVAPIVQSIWDAITVGAQYVYDTLAPIIQAIWDFLVAAFQGIYDTVSPIVQMLWDALTTGAQYVYDTLVPIVQAMWDTVVSIFQYGVDTGTAVVQTIWDFLVSTWQAIYDTVAPLAQSLWDAIVASFQYGVDTGTSLVQTIWDFLVSTWQSIYDTVSPIVQSLWDFIVDLWTTLSETTSTVFQAIWDFLSSTWQSIYDAVAPIVTSIYDWISSTWDSISSYTTSIFDTVMTFLSDTWNSIYDTASSILDSIAEYVSSTWDSIVSGVSGFASAFLEAVTSAMSTAVNKGLDIMAGMLRGFGEAVSGVIGDTGGIASALTGAASTVEGYKFADGGVASLGYATGGTDSKRGGLAGSRSPRMHLWGEGDHAEAFITRKPSVRSQNRGYAETAVGWLGGSVMWGNGGIPAVGFCEGGCPAGGCDHSAGGVELFENGGIGDTRPTSLYAKRERAGHYGRGTLGMSVVPGDFWSRPDVPDRGLPVVGNQLGATHYGWSADVQSIVDNIYSATGGCAEPNTYYGHAYRAGCTEDESADWWGGGRGGQIDASCADSIVAEAERQPLFTYWMWNGETSDFGPSGDHYEHVHTSFCGGDASGGGGGFICRNLKSGAQAAMDLAQGAAKTLIPSIGTVPPVTGVVDSTIDEGGDAIIDWAVAQIPGCGSSAGGSSSGSSAGGDCDTIAQNAVDAVGWGDASCFSSLLSQESSCDCGAQNASGASGVAQMMPSTFAAYDPGCGDIWDCNCNAMASLGYQQAVYGSPVCDAPYHKGGVIPGPSGSDQGILARAGERVLTEEQNRGFENLAFASGGVMIDEKQSEPLQPTVRYGLITTGEGTFSQTVSGMPDYAEDISSSSGSSATGSAAALETGSPAIGEELVATDLAGMEDEQRVAAGEPLETGGSLPMPEEGQAYTEDYQLADVSGENAASTQPSTGSTSSGDSSEARSDDIQLDLSFSGSGVFDEQQIENTGAAGEGSEFIIDTSGVSVTATQTHDQNVGGGLSSDELGAMPDEQRMPAGDALYAADALPLAPEGEVYAEDYTTVPSEAAYYAEPVADPYAADPYAAGEASIPMSGAAGGTYNWDDDVWAIAEGIYSAIGGAAEPNTYPGHPGGENRSIDWWGIGGRGTPVDYDAGNAVYNLAWGDYYGQLGYTIWQGWFDNVAGLSYDYAAEDPYDAHYDHIHTTFGPTTGYHKGGVIPGMGEQGILARGGERILTAGQNREFEKLVSTLPSLGYLTRELPAAISDMRGAAPSFAGGGRSNGNTTINQTVQIGQMGSDVTLEQVEEVVHRGANRALKALPGTRHRTRRVS